MATKEIDIRAEVEYGKIVAVLKAKGATVDLHENGTLSTVNGTGVWLRIEEQRPGRGWHRYGNGRLYLTMRAGGYSDPKTILEGPSKAGFNTEKVADAILEKVKDAEAAQLRRADKDRRYDQFRADRKTIEEHNGLDYSSPIRLSVDDYGIHIALSSRDADKLDRAVKALKEIFG